MTSCQHRGSIFGFARAPGKTGRKHLLGAGGYWNETINGLPEDQWTLGAGWVSHSFMVIPECPFPLLGQNLLTKMGAQIHFLPGETKILDQSGRPIQVLTIQLEDEYQLHQKPILPQWTFKYGWMNSPMHGLRQGEPALQAPPSYIYRSQARGRPCPGQQYPMTLEAQQGISPHICRLLAQKILRPCQSAWNTLLLPVKKKQFS